ncbi:MAG: hypothetical protein QM569_09750 [Acidovorax sp.]|uniref:hypothetical protein n=1 Tax=Acidovorax sp. TaxID=1872122 RepID=UPI0039E71C4C
MKWLDRLKSEKATATHPAKTAKTTKPVFAVSAGCLSGTFGNTAEHPQTTATHPAKTAQGPASFATVTGLEGASPSTVERFRAASLALDDLAGQAGVAEPDRWCWPHSTAMNGTEIDTFTARVARFADRGLGLEDVVRQAGALVRRDREGDDRRACLECVHLRGYGPWMCSNAMKARVTVKPWETGLACAMVSMLQRCPGFRAGAPGG